MQPCTRIYYSKFIKCLTCFERHTAHHQELKNYNCSLWFYIILWLPAAVIAEWELLCRGCNSVFELLMMSGVSLDTC